MNKPIFIVSVLLVAAAASAAYFAIELQQERERANSLAVRAFEHEPVESGGNTSTDAIAADWSQAPTVPPQIVQMGAQSESENAPAPPKPVMDFPGSLRTRQFVARLQTRLASGTPMQEYQIRALIEAFDGLESSPDDSESEQRIQAASDILFESQMEELVEMLKQD